MADNSELDQLLKAELEDITKESSGKFTIQSVKALEKQIAFLNGEPGSWCLNVVRAAVVAQATELAVQKTATEIRFFLSKVESWPIEQVEFELFNPEISKDKALDYLKRGLWSVAMRDCRPFLLMDVGWEQALFWTGSELKRQDSKKLPDKFYLAVLHQSKAGGNGLPFARYVDAAPHGREVVDQLLARAFTCPIPLKFDDHRIDSLKGCPAYGFSAKSTPIYLGFLAADIPSLPIPPASFEGFALAPDVIKTFYDAFKCQQDLPAKIAIAYLFTANIRRISSRDFISLERYSQVHTLFWIKDGVVLEQEELPWKEGQVSCALFASAEGLSTDVSGERLVRDERYQARSGLILDVFASGCQPVKASFKSLIASDKENSASAKRLMIMVILVFYAVLWGAFPIGGLAFTLVFIWFRRNLTLGSKVPGEILQEEINAAMDTLCEDIRQKAEKSKEVNN